MKKILITQFGSADVLQLSEVGIPTINENQLLIKVHAAGLNPIDYKIRNGTSFAAKELAHQLPCGLCVPFPC